MSLTRDIAAAVLPLSYDRLPEAARRAARASLAEGLAVMVAAVALEPAVQPFHAHAVQEGAGLATLFGGGSASVAMAALANGALAHALDFEDTYDAAGLHPNAAAIPALLALAEAEDSPLSEVLCAMAVGADLACRIGGSLTTDPADRHWYHPPMIGCVGAAMASAHLLRQTVEQAVSAVSLALTQFALTDALKRAPASDLRAIRDGFATRAAVEAALLARAGVRGTDDPVGEDGGLVHILTGSGPDLSAFECLGDRFLGAEVSFKLWPSCRGTHAAIALALALRDTGVRPERIASVRFTDVPPNDMLFHPAERRAAPQSAIDAKFSIPFTFARALSAGAPGLADFGEDARADPATHALAQRVTLERCSPDAGRAALIEWTDGTTETRPLPPPPSLPAGSTPFAALSAKFADCLSHAGLGASALKTLMTLETCPAETPIRSILSELFHGGSP